MRLTGRLAAGVVGSAAVHGGLILTLSLWAEPVATQVRPAGDEVVEFTVVETPPPLPEPEPEAVPEPPPLPEPEAVPEPPPPARPPARPRPRAAEATPEPAEPPPANDAAPEAPSDAPPPLIAGLSMSSTVRRGEGSGMRVGVGNTLYGTPEREARAPEAAQPYQGAERWVPPARVTRLPEVAHEVKVRYPDAAREAGIEGAVRLRLRIDEEGRVVAVQVLQGIGHGLDEAAAAALRRFRFRPATLDGRPVGTQIDYTYTWLLD